MPVNNFSGISGTPTLRAKVVEGHAAEVVLAQLRALFPGRLNVNLNQIVIGDLTFLAILKAGDPWIRNYCVKDDAKDEEDHLPPLCIRAD